jgi:hypothetical protein
METGKLSIEFSVTRLGEFTPFGRLFTLGRFLEIAKAAHIFGLFYPTAKVMH